MKIVCFSHFISKSAAHLQIRDVVVDFVGRCSAGLISSEGSLMRSVLIPVVMKSGIGFVYVDIEKSLQFNAFKKIINESILSAPKESLVILMNFDGKDDICRVEQLDESIKNKVVISGLSSFVY
jgi:hypothetical protein